MNRSDKPEGLRQQDLIKYPMLREVMNKHGTVGVLRVRKMSLRDIKELRDAYPNQTDNELYTEWFDSKDSVSKSNEEHYLIFYVSIKLKSIPEFSQTLVLIPVKENKEVVYMKDYAKEFTAAELLQYEEICTDLYSCMEDCLSGIDDNVFNDILMQVYYKYKVKHKVFDRINLCRFLFDAMFYAKEWNYSEDEGIGQELSIEYGYNPFKGTWTADFDWKNFVEPRKNKNGEVIGLRRFTLAQLNALKTFTENAKEAYKTTTDFDEIIKIAWDKTLEKIPESEITNIPTSFPEVYDYVMELSKLDNSSINNFNENVNKVGVKYGYNPENCNWDDCYEG